MCVNKGPAGSNKEINYLAVFHQLIEMISIYVFHANLAREISLEHPLAGRDRQRVLEWEGYF